MSIIPDAIELISKSFKANKFIDREKFDSFLNDQEYFSASECHCFYSKEDLDAFYNRKKESEAKCYVLKNVGKIVAAWDDKNQIGYIIPSK